VQRPPLPAQVTAHKSSRKASNENKSVRLPTNIDEINGMVQDITKQLHGQDIDRNLSLRVIQAALCIQRAYLEKKKKAGESTEHVVHATGMHDQVCSMHGISTRNYGSIIQGNFQNRSLYTSGPHGRPGNRQKRQTRIPETKKVEILLRVRLWQETAETKSYGVTSS
jgi:hypothetical protein